jgi:hypothetical protein
MANLQLVSTLGLILLFVLAQISTFKFNIIRNRFYAPFHFAGGFLVGTLLFSLTGNYIYTVFGTIGVGFLWEVYEYLLWRFVLKEDRFKQEKMDTIADIVLDFAGGLTAAIIFFLLLG